MEETIKICDLSDDLLLRILILVPAKDAVATAILSKRWRYIWQLLPHLTFEEEDSESFGWFVDKTMQLHKAPSLICLDVELGPLCPVDVDVTKWVDKAVNHNVRYLDFALLWEGEPTSFPKSLYTCRTLISLTLSNQILVDVSFPDASLPSLLYLKLVKVVYKDEDSLARLLSCSPVLRELDVQRRDEDENLTNFTVKVPSLKEFTYGRFRWGSDRLRWGSYQTGGSSLVIDCPALTYLRIYDDWGYYSSLMENMLCLDEVYISHVPNPDGKFLSCLSSARLLRLYLSESMVACCSNAINFSRLIDLIFVTNKPVHWLEPLIFMLQNSPKLKILTIDTHGSPTCSWNQPSTIPQCLSSHLEIVRWKRYQGKEEDEKQLMTYILANSKCLKTVKIFSDDLQECQIKELESMPRISASSQLLYSNAKAEWDF
ncbi:PREDICTED: putative F-box/FBD/LRR-repeat protein At1g22000 [Camelina sativa]|uniref:F-box/FBD/LRR-repeat protein At1g22000 n=1 Tax=Camelina sativa TaxID=90675 RepID=A0ABM0TJC0_CAMSA|nr:PREDICTED: putative F-box/FBD/LRR-repeat protein At1g22000 [Camelina sativa]XP_010427247.1 PREDICTED: putative F-box/FBD/LRR-repeat protein At1g22000 [Camelina sativa]XP_010427248.1 PREDICTED: putative F-box/FBD/LRR-repeat protein At1g22000 [Camelina sativa]